jgi:hypothetical protein
VNLPLCAPLQPPALLFACDDDEACEAAARQARRSTAGGRGCVLVLEGSQMGSLGELQVRGPCMCLAAAFPVGQPPHSLC